jgi:hypothetical protein
MMAALCRSGHDLSRPLPDGAPALTGRGRCRACSRASYARYREAHREERRAYEARYRTTAAGMLADIRDNAKRKGNQ